MKTKSEKQTNVYTVYIYIYHLQVYGVPNPAVSKTRTEVSLFVVPSSTFCLHRSLRLV